MAKTLFCMLGHEHTERWEAHQCEKDNMCQVVLRLVDGPGGGEWEICGLPKPCPDHPAAREEPTP